MSERKLPLSLMPPVKITNQQIAGYIFEMCRELRSITHDTKFKTSVVLDNLLDLIQDETRRIANEPDQAID